ncbi:MAG: 16S rRNA (cytosine(1402)-N(4))-methyltransferase RsmH [Verrucomicrobiae bacterium]|nr:16S rRNA (cytosine(1402)-N(4))-methyltransferase RsmH [Verrucomicrobiae bacterium]
MPEKDPIDPRLPAAQKLRRRLRYRGTHPRTYEEKYKELDPERDPETIAKVLASGKTPAGQHRPILVEEIMEHLVPQPGERGADVTFGYGGHSEVLLEKIMPVGQLLALDVDAVQLPRSEARLRTLGHDENTLIVRRSNFAGLAGVLGKIEWHDGVDFVLADLGLSSMQIDNPARGFSYKHDGPLDMRMNPERGAPARDLLARCKVEKLTRILSEGGDEPRAEIIAEAIVEGAAHAPIENTRHLRRIVDGALPLHLKEDVRAATISRVFQAIRIAVNDEFSALDAFLANLPNCLKPGGRVAILSFHSGEDRRVKLHFREGFRSGIYREISPDIIRPTPEEVGSNPRASSAKMRWAIRA